MRTAIIRRLINITGGEVSMLGRVRKELVALSAGFLLMSGGLHAAPLDGKKDILLVDKKGESIVVGTVHFKPDESGSHYELHMDHAKFRDYFLSMKEMKCLEGPELWCHLAYPYKQPNRVTQADLSWLSHDLMFMFKKKEEFGANFWNGIYYHMQVEGDEIRGEAQAVDLNVLASPPDDLNVPPMNEGERDEIDRTKRWLPDLIIR
ncbi:hypothetical protein ACMXYN_00260 [Neptuniibacter sp. PT8_73]|uniref:hypothetical protein n=1 Tax=unclassified Neptuniibacter TaxID=2630693 RepID=UPI0039F6D336